MLFLYLLLNICTLGIFLHFLLRLIFRQSHPDFINVRTAYASEIWAQLTKNLLTKSGTERFRENILWSGGYYEVVSFIGPAYWKAGQ